MTAKASRTVRAVEAEPSPAEPSHPVEAGTVFEVEANYRVRLNGIAAFLSVSLSPMHLHVVRGAVAEMIRDKIAAFDPV